MLRTLLIAGALLTASGTVLANQAYVHGSVVSVDPNFAVSYGSGPYNSGFSVMVSSGGVPYWGVPYGYAPAPVIVVPPPRYRVQHVHHHRGYGRGWDERRDWNDRRDDWRDDRRESRRGEQRRHGRD